MLQYKLISRQQQTQIISLEDEEMEQSKDEMLQEELEVNAAVKEMNLPQPDALMIALGTLLMSPILSKNRTF